MAASISIETEQGTYTGSRHPHNGYYAGEFGRLGELAESVPPPIQGWDAS